MALTPNPHKYGKEYGSLIIKQMGLLEERKSKSKQDDILLTQQATSPVCSLINVTSDFKLTDQVKTFYPG